MPKPNNRKNSSDSNKGRSRSSSDKPESSKPSKSFSKPSGDRKFSSDRSSGPKKSFSKPSSDRPERKPFNRDGANDSTDRPKRSYSKGSDSRGGNDSYSSRKPYNRDGAGDSSNRPKRSYSKGGDTVGGSDSYSSRKPYNRDGAGDSSDRPKRSYSKGSDSRGGNDSYSSRKPYNRDGAGDSSDRPKRSYSKDGDSRGGNDSYSSRKPYSRDGASNSDERPKRSYSKDGDRNYSPKEGSNRGGSYSKGKPFDKGKEGFSDRPKREYKSTEPAGKRVYLRGKPEEDGTKPLRSRKPKSTDHDEVSLGDGSIRLNRFLSNAGVASRREADVMIEAGLVKINGKIVTELGTKIIPGVDEVQYGGERVRVEKKVYILLNKPKNIITTTDDPEGRNTVMELLQDAPGERIFPVGRLDRNTTGVLLLTNDGDLANRLTHPKFGMKKVYIATLDKSLKAVDKVKLMEGITLDDGPVFADAVEYKDDIDKKTILIEIHSGRNRIIRRMFEALGYDVVKLDRTYFAGLTKTGLKRGQWRLLDEKEVNILRRQ